MAADIFLKFLRYLLPYRKKQIIVLILSGAGVLLGLVNPYLSKLVVDNALIKKELKTFIILGLIGTGVFVISGLMNALESFLKRGIHLKVSFDLNKKIFNHLQHLPLEFFKNKSTGECMFRINYDIERTVDFIVSIPEEFINIFPKLFFTLVIILYLNWQMALFSFILAPLLFIPIYYFTKRMRKILEELLSNSQNIFKRLEEVFSHIYLVKAAGKERAEARSYFKSLIVNMRINLKNTRLEIISSFANSGINRAIIGLIMLFGGYQVIRGRMTPGTLAAIMIYLSQLIGLQGNLAFFFQRINFGLISCKRLNEILEVRSCRNNTVNTGAVILQEPKIHFKNVNFGYNPQALILKEIGFNIEKGFFALAGPSGCGKTTILNLILRLYEPLKGEIYINGHDINTLDLVSLRNQIGVSLQEPFLWNDTIENNIKYLNPQLSRDEVISMAQLTGVHDFVKELPSGYQTVIGENACKISEGQKQKIAVTRALIKNPKILILDEAMSSMDSESEERIISEIRKLPIDIVILVSHRLSSVINADLVYFLKEPGRIVIDKPQSLLRDDSVFYNLFAAQTALIYPSLK